MFDLKMKLDLVTYRWPFVNAIVWTPLEDFIELCPIEIGIRVAQLAGPLGHIHRRR